MKAHLSRDSLPISARLRTPRGVAVAESYRLIQDWADPAVELNISHTFSSSSPHTLVIAEF